MVFGENLLENEHDVEQNKKNINSLKKLNELKGFSYFRFYFYVFGINFIFNFIYLSFYTASLIIGILNYPCKDSCEKAGLRYCYWLIITSIFGILTIIFQEVISVYVVLFITKFGYSGFINKIKKKLGFKILFLIILSYGFYLYIIVSGIMICADCFSDFNKTIKGFFVTILVLYGLNYNTSYNDKKFKTFVIYNAQYLMNLLQNNNEDPNDFQINEEMFFI
jgi:hypothetical protein